MKRIVIIASILIPLTAASSAAQGPAAADAAEKNLAAPANLTAGTVAGLAVGEAAAGEPSAAVQFILDATKDQKVGTVAIGWKNGSQNHFLLTLAGPLDSDSQAAPASLLGLPTGASFKLSGTRLLWSGPSGTEQLEIQQICQDLFANGITPCQTDNASIPAVQRAALRQLLHENSAIWFVGGDVTAERSGFRYLQTGTLAAGAENHQTWTAQGRLGYYTPVGFLFGSLSYRRGYVPGGTPADVCRPIAGTDALRCQSSVIGAPKPIRQKIASLELRRFFADSPIAITPSVQRDFEEDVTVVEVPIYFLRAGSSLTGGVRFGWRSDTEELTAVVFVGTAIGLLP